MEISPAMRTCATSLLKSKGAATEPSGSRENPLEPVQVTLFFEAQHVNCHGVFSLFVLNFPTIYTYMKSFPLRPSLLGSRPSWFPTESLFLSFFESVPAHLDCV